MPNTIRSAIRALFPNLAEWPAEKWLALPIVLWVNYGLIIETTVDILNERGWYEHKVVTEAIDYWGQKN